MLDIATYLPIRNGNQLPCYLKEEPKAQTKKNATILIKEELDNDQYLIEDEILGYQHTIHKSIITDNHFEIKDQRVIVPADLSETWFKKFHDARDKNITNEQQLLFTSHLKNFYDHKEIIYSNSRYFLTPLPVDYFGLAYSGPIVITLGMLLELWDTFPDTTDTHQDCGGQILIYSFGGSPLSGSHSWQGFCRKCLEYTKGSKDRFPDLWHPFKEQANRYSQYLQYDHATIDEIIATITNSKKQG